MLDPETAGRRRRRLAPKWPRPGNWRLLLKPHPSPVPRVRFDWLAFFQLVLDLFYRRLQCKHAVWGRGMACAKFSFYVRWICRSHPSPELRGIINGQSGIG